LLRKIGLLNNYFIRFSVAPVMHPAAARCKQFAAAAPTPTASVAAIKSLG
jgi:hypothetical protein